MNNLRFRMASTAVRRLKAEEIDRKKFPRVFQRNPLISLDYDERIQGNPIAGNWSFRGEMGRAQENPNGSALVKGYSSSSPGSGSALAPGMT
jgi:hypothetical protein